MPLRGENLTTVGEFTVAAGETVPFVLTYAPVAPAVPQPLDAGAALVDDRAVLDAMDVASATPARTLLPMRSCAR